VKLGALSPETGAPANTGLANNIKMIKKDIVLRMAFSSITE
jgi:hypothetical protein